MKRFLLAVSLALALGASLPAQQTFQPIPPMIVSAALPSAPTVSDPPSVNLVPSFTFPAGQPALPAPSASPAPAPQFGGSTRGDFYRWDLGIGYEFMHFDSKVFSANLSGLQTDLTYNFRDWIGVEGNVVSAWGDKVFGATSKAVLFTGGIRIGEGTSKHRWTPWGHALVGGLHMWPQTAGNDRLGFAAQLGGGADYRLNDRLSIRASADYVRSQLYSSSQNNYQFGIGAVIHF
jgi:opacity protein-like surface antigen